MTVFGDYAIDFGQIQFISFRRDKESRQIESAKLVFRNGREDWLDKPSAIELAQFLSIGESGASDGASTTAITSDIAI